MWLFHPAGQLNPCTIHTTWMNITGGSWHSVGKALLFLNTYFIFFFICWRSVHFENGISGCTFSFFLWLKRTSAGTCEVVQAVWVPGLGQTEWTKPLLVLKSPWKQELVGVLHTFGNLGNFFYRHLVSITGEGKVGINNNYNGHLGGSLSFVCVVVCVRARSPVIFKDLNSPALLFPSKAKYIVQCLWDLFTLCQRIFCALYISPL